MKTKIALALALMLSLAGCHSATSTTPSAALAPGFTSQTDQTLDQVLVGAHNFYTTIQADVNSGSYTPTATTLKALNAFGTALNAAEAVYVAYHNGTATLAQAQAAVATVSTQQAALQTVVTGATH